jgi:uncharacterized protein with GYD domain
MSTFFFFGKYSQEAVKEISAKRTERANALIEMNGGKIKSGYALLGKYDLVLIIEFPDVNQALKTSVELAKLPASASPPPRHQHGRIRQAGGLNLRVFYDDPTESYYIQSP